MTCSIWKLLQRKASSIAFMRGSAGIFIFLFLFLFSTDVRAEGFRVFEKDGYFGVLDPAGEVSVPAVYHRLGWSDGSTVIQNGVIGFKEGSLWGLITVKNKVLSVPKFYTVKSLVGGYIKASVKGKFSNRLFYGLLDVKGNVKISFNHFSIEPMGANWLVSDFEYNRQSFGLISFENQLLIPKIYHNISASYGVLQGLQHEGDIDLFTSDGVLLHAGLDSLIWTELGWKVYRDGYAGFLKQNGELWLEFKHKDIIANGNNPEGMSFPTWQVFEGEELRLVKSCDSIAVTENSRLLAYLNGAHHLLVEDSSIEHNPELLIRDIVDGHYIIQNSKTRKWSVLLPGGDAILTDYDSIYAANDRYVLKANGLWQIAARDGQVLNNRPFQRVKSGLGNQLIAKRNDYWGILDMNLESISPFKYDSISVLGTYYLVSYLNGFGLMTDHCNWLVKASYDQVYLFGDFVVGRKRNAFTYFLGGKEVYYSTHAPIELLGSSLLISSEEGRLGLMNAYGELQSAPEYDDISFLDGLYLFYKGGKVQVLDQVNRAVINFDEGYDHFESFSEGLAVVRKDNRYGFIDLYGRLRISNRYNKARSFSEGRAPVLLRGRWGFIDKDEQLIIQPHYQEVSAFVDGISIVADGSGYGLVDLDGHEVIEPGWQEIKRLSTGNFAIKSSSGRLGLVDKEGKFLLRPDFEYLQDLGQSVIVAKNGSWGILNHNGVPLVEMSHQEVKVVANLTLIKD